MKDFLVKAIAHNKQVRAHTAITTKTIEEAKRRQDMQTVISVVLRRFMTAGVILGSMQKGEKNYS
ncbi:Hsp33 family molecular chaperone HslO [Psychrobacillus antarcticus]|uniref:Hsp33 family molecular chaperone HslO n=1 Tax=Psychrobacillus antarcticus TaxID=2879115 RepID=UPI0024081D1A|nr:Hsp33 family molecular chaperone HslO [Psychrobacillus antarcticus]